MHYLRGGDITGAAAFKGYIDDIFDDNSLVKPHLPKPNHHKARA
jgi:hypothetical protein